NEMTVLIELHIAVLGERSEIHSFGLAKHMNTFTAYRTFNIRLAALCKHLFRKCRTLAVLSYTMVEIDTSNAVFTIQCIGKRNAAVLPCILASCVKVRPC